MRIEVREELDKLFEGKNIIEDSWEYPRDPKYPNGYCTVELRSPATALFRDYGDHVNVMIKEYKTEVKDVTT